MPERNWPSVTEYLAALLLAAFFLGMGLLAHVLLGQVLVGLAVAGVLTLAGAMWWTRQDYASQT